MRTLFLISHVPLPSNVGGRMLNRLDTRALVPRIG